MFRTLAALLIVACASSAQAQGILNRAGEALDNAGRTIRQGVENAVNRTEVAVQERDLAASVVHRVRSDKRLTSSTIQMEVRPDGSVVLRGSVIDAAARKTAVELVENTIGVTTVVDELALMKDVKVIEAKPTTTIIETKPPGTVIERTPAPKVITSKPVAPAQPPVVIEPPATVKP
ncbi:BON domain-containing protein [Paludisphaera rhizosphaerae]|uniref:BON domain-containing protein n=1 Tax=Paludisphaera rhizosphaerae TaxID=2711216 RepID=UPI0013EA7580|nr:BON domain-containing protein [Paludisphaera rhizosphaerae]